MTTSPELGVAQAQGESLEAEQALAIGRANHVDAGVEGRLDRLPARITDKSPAAQTEDAREGQAALRDKRAPQWRGR